MHAPPPLWPNSTAPRGPPRFAGFIGPIPYFFRDGDDNSPTASRAPGPAPAAPAPARGPPAAAAPPARSPTAEPGGPAPPSADADRPRAAVHRCRVRAAALRRWLGLVTRRRRRDRDRDEAHRQGARAPQAGRVAAQARAARPALRPAPADAAQDDRRPHLAEVGGRDRHRPRVRPEHDVHAHRHGLRQLRQARQDDPGHRGHVEVRDPGPSRDHSRARPSRRP